MEVTVEWQGRKIELTMEDSHRSDTSETAPQPGSTVQGGDISYIAQQVSFLSESEESQDSYDSTGFSQEAHEILARRPSYRNFFFFFERPIF